MGLALMTLLVRLACAPRPPRSDLSPPGSIPGHRAAEPAGARGLTAEDAVDAHRSTRRADVEKRYARERTEEMARRDDQRTRQGYHRTHGWFGHHVLRRARARRPPQRG